MSAMNIHTFTTNVSTVGASATVPIWKISDSAGGITVLDAQITGTSAGTPVGLRIISLTDATAPVLAGTVCKWGGTFSAGTITMGAGTVFEATMVTPAVEPGLWLGIQNTSGTTPAISFVTISYIQGY